MESGNKKKKEEERRRDNYKYANAKAGSKGKTDWRRMTKLCAARGD